MKKTLRLTLVVVGLGIVAAAGFSVFVWKILEDRINSPGFKTELENQLSKQSGGHVAIGRLMGHLGLKPWMSAHEVVIHLATQGIDINASGLTVELNILPLLHGEIDLSEISIDHPQLVINYSKEEPERLFAKPVSSKKSESKRIRVETFSLNQARVTVLDPSKSAAPVIELEGDAALHFSAESKSESLEFTGKLRGAQGAGSVKAKGRLSPDLDLELTAMAIPLDVVGLYFPVVSSVNGALDATIHLRKTNGPLAWVAHGRLTDIAWKESKQPIPLSLEGTADNEGALNLTADWRSDLTIASATLESPRVSDGHYSIQLHGTRFDSVEVKRFVEEYTASISKVTRPPPKGTTSPIIPKPWDLTAAWDMRNLMLPIASVSRMQGRATIGPKSGQISDFKLESLGGTLTASGSWTVGAGNKPSALINLRAHGNGFSVEQVLDVMISSSSISGALNFDLTLVGFPMPQTKNDVGVALLGSILKSREVKLNMDGEATFGERTHVRNIVGTLSADAPDKLCRAGLKADWDEGHLRCDASFARLNRAEGDGPLDLSIDIEHMDLEWIPGLARRFDLTRGLATANVHWRSPRMSERMFEAFSPDSAWSVQAQLHELAWRRVDLNDFSGRAAWNGTALTVEDMRGRISSGTFAAQGSLSGKDSSGFHHFSIDAEARDIDIGPFMFSFSTNPSLVGGHLTSTVKLSGHCNPGDDRSLTGKVTVQGKNGALGTEFILLKLLTNLNLDSLFRAIAGQHQKGLLFDVATATATVGGGQFTFNQPAVVKNPGFEVAYTGVVGTDMKTAQGTVVLNSLVEASNVLGAIPGVSDLVLGDNGEFLPLVVDISYTDGKFKKDFRSIKTLTGPVLTVLRNVLHLPRTLFGGRKHQPPEE